MSPIAAQATTRRAGEVLTDGSAPVQLVGAAVIVGLPPIAVCCSAVTAVPIWEYGNLSTDTYRPFDTLSPDLGLITRYVAIDLLFTSSPLCAGGLLGFADDNWRDGTQSWRSQAAWWRSSCFQRRISIRSMASDASQLHR